MSLCGYCTRVERPLPLYTLLVRANPRRREERSPCADACREITIRVREGVFRRLGDHQTAQQGLFETVVKSDYILPEYLWQRGWS